MKLYIAPEKVRDFEKYIDDELPIIFLAGSIEQGTADEWQTRFIKALTENDCIILNPRRENWDASWEQSIKNKQFKEQVLWELNGLKKADTVVIYFDPATKAPISLLELGMVGTDKKKNILVYCPEGFYRKGNVDIFSEMYDIDVYTDEDELIKKLKESL